MHGNRHEHPEVFKARMQYHKDKKRDQQKDAPKEDAKDSKDSKRPMPLTRKPC